MSMDVFSFFHFLRASQERVLLVREQLSSHPFIQHFLSINYALNTALGAKDTTLNRVGKVPIVKLTF